MLNESELEMDQEMTQSEVFKIGEKLRRSCDNHGSFLNSRKHVNMNIYPKQSNVVMDSSYQLENVY